MERLTARELFDKVKDRLALRWVAGEHGEKRAIAPAEKQARRPSLVGYLNIIYPNKIQIIGTRGAELARWTGFAPALGSDAKDRRATSRPR